MRKREIRCLAPYMPPTFGQETLVVMATLVGTKDRIWWSILSGRELIESTPPKRWLGFCAPAGALLSSFDGGSSMAVRISINPDFFCVK